MKNTREKAKLTLKKLDSLTGQKGRRHIVSDTEIAGFRAVVGESTKTFILERRITGVTTAPQKFTIGQYPAMHVEVARDIARRWTQLCRDGQDPTRVIMERNQKDGVIYSLKPKIIKRITVSHALELHIEYKNPAESTILFYSNTLKTQAPDWSDRPLDDIKMEDIIKRAQKVAGDVSNSRAVKLLKTIRAIWNTAKDYADSQGIPCPGNPLKLMRVHKMFTVDPKKVVIPFSLVGRFIAHAEEVRNDPTRSQGIRTAMRLYLISLFLGMRNGEARRLKWDYIDLETGYFKLPGQIVKNKKTHIKPIGPYALSIFKELYERRLPGNPYVFPTPSREKKHRGKHISTHRAGEAVILEGMPDHCKFNPHALRRTFISLADEINTPRKVLKNLVNHISGDVTDGYCVKEFNPQKEGPYLNRIEQALLICRDKHKNNEPLPTLAIDLFPKESDAELEKLKKERDQLAQEQSRVEALKKELAEKDEQLRQAKLEIQRLTRELEDRAA
ncbi:MAG: tyrosine-type recombinase/integrase [Acidobacteriota bacterium]|nr:tyrosine-type recombinase/integrase [Acidobacteriota bacterium]